MDQLYAALSQIKKDFLEQPAKLPKVVLSNLCVLRGVSYCFIREIDTWEAMEIMNNTRSMTFCAGDGDIAKAFDIYNMFKTNEKGILENLEKEVLVWACVNGINHLYLYSLTSQEIA